MSKSVFEGYKDEGKIVPVLHLNTTPWRRIAEVEVQLHALFTSALDTFPRLYRTWSSLSKQVREIVEEM
jgi:hypothetical protein